MTKDDYEILSTPAYPALFQISELMRRANYDYESPFFLVSQDLFADAFVEIIEHYRKTGQKIITYEGNGTERNNFLFKGFFVTYFEE